MRKGTVMDEVLMEMDVRMLLDRHGGKGEARVKDVMHAHVHVVA